MKSQVTFIIDIRQPWIPAMMHGHNEADVTCRLDESVTVFVTCLLRQWRQNFVTSYNPPFLCVFTGFRLPNYAVLPTMQTCILLHWKGLLKPRSPTCHTHTQSGAIKGRGFPFLELPGEVRNRIYRLLLVENPPICIPCDPEIVAVHLLRVCRQIHEEAIPILYQENTIGLDYVDLLSSEPFECLLAHRQHIRKIALCTTFGEIFRLSVSLSDLFGQLSHPDVIEIYGHNYLWPEVDAIGADSKLNKHLRDDRSLIGRLLTNMPSLDIWIRERQIVNGAHIRIVDQGQTDTNNDIGNNEDGDEDVSGTSSSETGMSNENTSQSLGNMSDNSDGVRKRRRLRKEVVYHQRFVLRKAILDPDYHVPFSVLTVPSHVRDWHYAPLAHLGDESESAYFPFWTRLD